MTAPKLAEQPAGKRAIVVELGVGDEAHGLPRRGWVVVGGGALVQCKKALKGVFALVQRASYPVGPN